jgi:hypothetical protein
MEVTKWLKPLSFHISEVAIALRQLQKVLFLRFVS